MATILSYTKSTYGSPYAFYKCDVSVSNRTKNSITITAIATGYLQYSSSWLGTGAANGLTASLYVGGVWHSWTLKATNTTWRGTSTHSSSTSFTVSGLTSSQTSLTGIQFKVSRTSSSANNASLTAKTCSNITFDKCENADSIWPQNNAPLIGQVTDVRVRAEYYPYHDLVVCPLNMPGYEIVVSGDFTDLTKVIWEEDVYAPLFPTDSKQLTVSLKSTGYSSIGSTTSGLSSTWDMVLTMPRYVGKPSMPSAKIISRNSITTTIQLIEPTTYKYGASFGYWDVSCSHGTVEFLDENNPNIVTLTIPEGLNETIVVYIKAIDTRGIDSDELHVVCYTRQYGSLVYKDGIYVHGKPYVYEDNTWKASNAYIYNDNTWKE